MNKKTVTIILVVVAILLVGFLVFKPSNKDVEKQEEPIVTEPVEVEEEVVENEIIFEESPIVVEVTSSDDQGFAADEYTLSEADSEEVYEDANAIDFSKYVKTENSFVYDFDGTEEIVLPVSEETEEIEEATGEEPVETETEIVEAEPVIKIEAGDKLALYLNNGVKTIVVYKA